MGAKAAGAPVGNRNALKYGMYTREAIAERRAMRALIRKMEEGLQEIEGG